MSGLERYTLGLVALCQVPLYLAAVDVDGLFDILCVLFATVALSICGVILCVKGLRA